ncbi:stage V sporulation protein D [Clostridium tepidiprofundi DSM 19306]|uniref:Stage V sporulation protein D n=1 Tax=Clostridium tepidiprofundi DSM 19306 TaxID=1121338 RepID=A0A151B6T2_9CLOT|nr:stage V sporulation protein D [Clostridium tepidiprofundi DSM 19306]
MGIKKYRYRDRVLIKKRTIITFFIFISLFMFLIGRLGYIMIGKSEDYKNRAIGQWTHEVKISPKRGKILDRNGYELAVSANVYRVDVDLNALRNRLKEANMDMSDISPSIATILDMDENVVLKKLTAPLPNGKPRGSAIIKRRVQKEEIDKLKDYIKQKRLYGIIISPDTKRYYPNGNFLAHVLGNTNSDGVGRVGVELVYNKYLAGIPGIKIAELDKNNKNMPYIISDYVKPVDGKNVVLTIDQTIQYFCEKAAEQAMVDYKAKGITIMVMNPNNGEILALVNKPDYNPNEPYDNNKTLDENQRLWRNRAVSDTFEPGSIFKVVTATAAMEEGKVSDDDVFVCNGSRKVANRIIHCWKRTGHGSQHLADILKNSCNVGFMILGERLGPELLNKYIKLFGFGKKTGIDLNGEARGIIKKTSDITPVALATISFGQTNTVSCVQYLTAFNAIANGGELITPHVMKEITHYDNENNVVVDKKYDNFNRRRILDENTMRELRGYLEKVVSEGGGKEAYIKGYHIAGKTGTAQKVDNVRGGYAHGKYIASFAGMAPADNPQVTVFVSIDEPDPSNYYSSHTAAPTARQVFMDIFNYLSFKPDVTGEEVAKSLLKDVVVPEIRGLEREEAIKILKSKNLKYDIESTGKYISEINPKPGCTVKEGAEIIVYTSDSPLYESKVVVPNLYGYNKEEAEKLLKSLGLKPSFIGKGLVSEQSISEGTEVLKDTKITLELQLVGD